MRTINLFEGQNNKLRDAEKALTKAQNKFWEDALNHVSEDSAYKAVKVIGSIKVYCIDMAMVDHGDGVIYEVPNRLVVVADTDAGVLVFPAILQLEETEWDPLNGKDGHIWKASQIELLPKAMKRDLFQAIEELDTEFTPISEGDKLV